MLRHDILQADYLFSLFKIYLITMKFLYFIFIFIVQNSLICKILAELIIFNYSNGNCSKVVSYMETYKEPYLESYRQKTWGIFYKTRYRWNYRIQYRKTYRKEFMCCEGYKLTSKREINVERKINTYSKCEPICEPACEHGTCVRPNVCICNNGYRKENFNYVCVPKCTHPCIHGKCSAPEVCTCNPGYELNGDGYTCEPVCNVPCPTQSYCYEPDQCVCISGYEMINEKLNNITCQPICERECIHGKCAAPNTCACDDGYEPDPYDIFACKPKCEDNCFYGKCTAPNVCTCDEGYSLKNPNTCEPICSQPCVNGTCVAPEICSCFVGYGLLDNSYVCEPICEKACLNGHCTTPGVCTCDEGFELIGDETEKHVCKPHCTISCEPFGTCTAPDVCTCFEGYRLKNLTEKMSVKQDATQYFVDNSVCEPICEVACINAFCSAPYTCLCNIGYHLLGSNHSSFWCGPTCNRDCINGFCSAPETCTCNEGYRFSKLSNVCEPFCETDCINGYCIAPNKCICKSGYQPTEGNRTSLCEPICNPSCKNGICTKPQICNCDPGYRLSKNPKTNVCDPICHPACEINGICEAPDLCVCKDGYRMVYYDAENTPFGCEPICDVECGNGTCTAPNTCTCFDGYRNAEIGGCEPICTTCDNGKCIAPEVCECDDGFVLANIEIELDKITHSTAVPENEMKNASRCVPHCENCDNGECVAPNECRCRAGFLKSENTCVHACQGGCGTHGECIDERRSCECNYGWTGPHCNQPTFCVLILNEERNHTELTIIEKRNTTIEYILINNPICSECISKVNNETLCFKMLVNATMDKIGCLMNEACLTMSSQYKDHEKIIQVTSGIASGILLLIIIIIYLIFRKRRNKQMDSENVEINSRHNESIQRLIE